MCTGTAAAAAAAGGMRTPDARGDAGAELRLVVHLKSQHPAVVAPVPHHVRILVYLQPQQALPFLAFASWAEMDCVMSSRTTSFCSDT